MGEFFFFFFISIYGRKLQVSEVDFTLFSSNSPSLVSPSAFSESESKPPPFSKRSSKESSSSYHKYKSKAQN
jgi:hypothetical protein